jgi:hypothetical protein
MGGTSVAVVLTVLALVYALSGWFGREFVLEHNECEMTYTTMAKSSVRVNSSVTGFRLYKHPSGASTSSSSKLNPQPVLFIPGHRGKYVSTTILTLPFHLSAHPYLPFPT